MTEHTRPASNCPRCTCPMRGQTSTTVVYCSDTFHWPADEFESHRRPGESGMEFTGRYLGERRDV